MHVFKPVQMEESMKTILTHIFILWPIISEQRISAVIKLLFTSFVSLSLIHVGLFTFRHWHIIRSFTFDGFFKLHFKCKKVELVFFSSFLCRICRATLVNIWNDNESSKVNKSCFVVSTRVYWFCVRLGGSVFRSKFIKTVDC